ncbi:MAG: nucleotidyltransferase family protein [Candidatus Omnitrophota bacterium]
MRHEASSYKEEILDLIQGGIDWGLLSKLACEKGIASLTYKALKFYAPAGLTQKENLDILKTSYLISSTKNNFYKKELKNILSILYEKNIPIIPLKGMMLSCRLYGDIASRGESADSDLLIKEKDKDKAIEILKELGYEMRFPLREVRSRDWFYIFNKKSQKMIELHWDITMMNRTSERIKGLWEGIELREWEGVKYYDLDPEELLIYLSIHLVNSDSFKQLRYICDIERLLSKYKENIDWGGVIKKSMRWKSLGSLYASLYLNKIFFNSTVNKEMLDKVKISSIKKYFIRTFANKKVIFGPNIRRRLLDNFLSYVFLELIEAKGIKDYIAIVKRVLFPPKESMGEINNLARIYKGGIKVIKNILIPKS